MSQQQINPGSPPIIWSEIASAFDVINDNFTELYASVGGDAVDFTSLGTNLIPRTTELHDLGSITKRWRDLWLSGSSIHLGDAVITSTGTTVNLPVGSTIGGLRVDENYFKFIAVAGQDNIEADDGTDTLTVASGNSGITLNTNASTDTLTIINSGVTSISGTTGQIGVNQSVGDITITNLGVTSASAGQGISLNSSTGSVIITNSGIVGLDAGIGIQLSPRDPVTGIITITNSQPNIPQQVFSIVAVPTQTPLAADSTGDTLNIEASGDGLSITTAPLTDTLTFTNTGVTSLAVGSGLAINAGTGAINLTLDATLNRNIVGNVTGDINGSVFADDSTLMVDAVDNRLFATSLDAIGVRASVIDGPTGIGLLQIKAGAVSDTGSTIFINPYGSDTYINSRAETHIWNTGPYSSSGNPYIDFKTAGAFTAHDGAYFAGNLTGDVIGSVFADDSTLLVDGTNGVLPIEKVAGITLTGGDSTGSDLIITTLTNPDRSNGCGIGIYPGTASGTASDVGHMIIAGGASEVNALDGGSVFIRGGSNISGGTGGTVNITGGYSDVSDFGEIKIGESNTLSVGIRNDNIVIGKEGGTTNVYGTLVFRNDVNFSFATNIIGFSGNVTGDLTGSVFADDSTLLIDGTEGTISAAALTGALPAIDGSALTGVIAASVDWTDVANTPTTLSGYGITDAATSAQGSLADSAIQPADLGSFTFTGSTLDTSDSSGISVTPAVTFNSDVTVENELIVTNSVTAGSFVGNLTATSVITSAITTSRVRETIVQKVDATGTVVHDLSESSVFYHTSIDANFTANFTNLDIASGQGTNISLILVQAGTGYIPNAVQIAGAAQTINWQDSTEPSGATNKIDIVTFSIINIGGTYTVFGALATFGA